MTECTSRITSTKRAVKARQPLQSLHHEVDDDDFLLTEVRTSP